MSPIAFNPYPTPSDYQSLIAPPKNRPFPPAPTKKEHSSNHLPFLSHFCRRPTLPSCRPAAFSQSSSSVALSPRSHLPISRIRIFPFRSPPTFPFSRAAPSPHPPILSPSAHLSSSLFCRSSAAFPSSLLVAQSLSSILPSCRSPIPLPSHPHATVLASSPCRSRNPTLPFSHPYPAPSAFRSTHLPAPNPLSFRFIRFLR